MRIHRAPPSSLYQVAVWCCSNSATSEDRYRPWSSKVRWNSAMLHLAPSAERRAPSGTLNHPLPERNPRLGGVCGLEFRLQYLTKHCKPGRTSWQNLAETGRAQPQALALWSSDTASSNASTTSCLPIGQMMSEGLVMANGLAWTLLPALGCFQHHAKSGMSFQNIWWHRVQWVFVTLNNRWSGHFVLVARVRLAPEHFQATCGSETYLHHWSWGGDQHFHPIDPNSLTSRPLFLCDRLNCKRNLDP